MLIITNAPQYNQNVLKLPMPEWYGGSIHTRSEVPFGRFSRTGSGGGGGRTSGVPFWKKRPVDAGGSVRIRFLVEQDQDGYPAVENEGLWGVLVGDDRYKLDSVPWMVRGVSFGDVVRAEPGRGGELWGKEVLQRSGHLTIRVMRDPEAGEQQDSLI